MSERNRKIRFGSLCSGIEAASVAWCESLGWECAFVAEIEEFPCAALKEHYPDVPNLGDITANDFIDRAKQCGPIDVLVGGTPCQAFSIAGNRGSLSDNRGNLTLRYLEIANEIDPEWVIWENVPGVLNTSDNAFGCFVGGLAGGAVPVMVGSATSPGFPNAGLVRGPRRTIGWRVLNAQYFGLAQRRERVFIIGGRSGSWTDPAKVLFEPECGDRDSSEKKRARRDNADSFGKMSGSGSQWDGSVVHPTTTRGANDTGGVGGSNQEVFSQRGANLVLHCVNSRQDPVSCENVVLPLDANLPTHAIIACYRMLAFGEYREDTVASTMKARDYKDATDLIVDGKREGEKILVAVRRLMPIEHERLQGFPDNWTKIEWKGKSKDDCPDGHRYKATGNSMPVKVMYWIARRINAVMAARGTNNERKHDDR